MLIINNNNSTNNINYYDNNTCRALLAMTREDNQDYHGL